MKSIITSRNGAKEKYKIKSIQLTFIAHDSLVQSYEYSDYPSAICPVHATNFNTFQFWSAHVKWESSNEHAC